MGMLEDDLDEGMRLTTERMKATGEKYEEARRNVIAGHSKMEGRRLVHYTPLYAPVITEPTGPFTRRELQATFGDSMPIEALDFIFGDEAKAMTMAEVRAHVRATYAPVPPAPDETHITAWMPEPDVHIHQVIAKLGEELSEAAARCFRILESGYHEPDPDTKRPNWVELQRELADIDAVRSWGRTSHLMAFEDDEPRITAKFAGFKRWEGLIQAELAKQGKVK